MIEVSYYQRNETDYTKVKNREKFIDITYAKEKAQEFLDAAKDRLCFIFIPDYANCNNRRYIKTSTDKRWRRC